MQTERLCQLSFRGARQTTVIGQAKVDYARGKYGPKPTIPLTGNQEVFTT